MPGRLNPMPMVDPLHRFVLFTNAKCGGTTLKAWFFDNVDFVSLHRRPDRLLGAFGLRYTVSHLRRGRRLAATVAQTRGGPGESEPYKAALRDFIRYYRAALCWRVMVSPEAESYFRICVVRNPFDRIVSAYLDKFCSFGRDGRDAPYVAEVLRALGTEDPTFLQFLGYLETADEAECNPHWRRQTYITEGQRIDALVRLEHLHDEMAAHAAVVGAEHLDLLRRKLQSTGRAAPTAVEDLSGTPSLEIAAGRAASGRFPPFACFLTPETRARIRAIYAADFAQLPYEA